MHIKSLDCFRYRIPMRRDRSARRIGGVSPVRTGLLLRARAALRNGASTESWGEIAPYPGRSRESLSEAEDGLRETIVRLIGAEVPVSWDALRRWDPAGDAPASVAFGVESVMVALGARQVGQSPAIWVAPGARNTVAVNALLDATSGSIDREAADRAAEGYRVFKVKVGRGRPEFIHELVTHLRATVGLDAEIRLDANRSWSFDEAERILRALGGEGVSYVEEPLRDAGRLTELAGSVAIPIAVDESLEEWSRAGRAAGGRNQDPDARRSARIVTELPDLEGIGFAVLKPTVLGGVLRSMEIAADLHAHAVTPVISSVFETEIGLRTLRMLAAVIPGDGVAAGLDTNRYIVSNFLSGLTGPAASWRLDEQSVAEEAVMVDRLEYAFGQ